MKTLERPKEELPVSLPGYKRWSVEDCDRLRELDFLPEKYELIEGVVIDRMGQTSRHATLICALLCVLAPPFGIERVRIQCPICILGELGLYNEPVPDASVTQKTYHSYNDNPTPADLLLVAEVSDRTLRSDLTTKALLYAKAGIPEYWVVDIKKSLLLVHRSPTTEGYTDITEWSVGESVAPLALPDRLVSVTELFSKEGS